MDARAPSPPRPGARPHRPTSGWTLFQAGEPADAGSGHPGGVGGSRGWLRRGPLAALTIILALVSLFFLSFPKIDTAVSARFYDDGHGFVGIGNPDLATVREFGNAMTIAILSASVLAIFAGLLARPPRWLMRPSEGLFIICVYAIGPGLIVNAILKSTSGRVRPRDLTQFGGSLDFTPIWQFGGQCIGNCSFSSGEAAAAASVLALVFVAPRGDRFALALGLGAVAAMISGARIAAGGHFLSDVLVSWIIVLALIAAFRPLFLGPQGWPIDAALARLGERLRRPLPKAAATLRDGLAQPRDIPPQSDVAALATFPYDGRHSMDNATLPLLSRTRPRRFAMVSVVVPAKNEADNLGLLVPEIAAALAGRDHEIVVVDDGSTDGTEAMIARLRADRIAVRHIRHERSAGQSRAVRSGVLHAAGDCIVTIDGDGQNDPAFIPAMVERLEEGGPACGLVAGQRTGRTDSPAKRLASRAANRLRTAILKDSTRDTGCGLKALPTDLFRRLPYFDGWHRYLPALVLREELTIGHLDVKDRQRRFGQSNYGIFDRAARGALDLFGVWWILRRGRRTPGRVEDVTASKE